MATASEECETFTMESAIRGHHIYKGIWTPVLGQVLETKPEEDNAKDAHAVGVLLYGQIVGHMPKEISSTAWHFLQHAGTITCCVTAQRRKSPVPGKGLEVPCTYTFKGRPKMIKKLIKILIECTAK